MKPIELFLTAIYELERKHGYPIGGFAKNPAGEWQIVDMRGKFEPMIKKQVDKKTTAA